MNIPSRPELDATTTTQDRVWNTLIRADHQITANHTWSVRWLREQSPQKNQIIGRVTLAAAREESDVDQTFVFNLNSVLGNTRVNTVRFNLTRENVAFANPCFNGNGRRQDQCAPTLTMLTFTDQQSSVAQARINNGWQLEDTFGWFRPSRAGDHDIKFGVQYQYSTGDYSTQDNLNGTFVFATDLPFSPDDPRTYPERLQIRVPGANSLYIKTHYLGVFGQDKWKMNNRLTLSLGARYDVEIFPVNEANNPFFDFGGANNYPVDTNNISPRVGFSYDASGNGRGVLRGGYGLFYDKTHQELVTALFTAGLYSNSFIASFPANQADPGPSAGQLPTDPMLVNGPTVNRDLLATLFGAGAQVKNTGNVFVDNPDRRIPYTHQVSIGYERQVGATLAASADYVHAIGRDMFMTQDLNPGVRVSPDRTASVERIDPTFAQSVFTRINAGKTDYDALELQFQKRFSGHYGFRVSYTLSSSRGNTGAGFVPQPPFQFLDNLNLGLPINQGPTDFDRRHNLVVSGSTLVPRTGITVSWVARYLSGLPFTVLDTSTDTDLNGILFDPLPAGSYSGSGVNAITVQSDGHRNGATGPDFFQLDTRIGYRVRAGGDRTLDLFAEVFNLTNRANFNNPTGDQRSPNFLVLTDLRAGAVPRTAQLGVRFGF